MRINKFIANSGHCSRRKADELIERGNVFINNKRATLGDQVGPQDVVRVGKKVISKARPSDHVYLAFHKPVGVITTSDKKAKDNIMQFFRKFKHIYPVGRLDVASSGLIFMTNDGEFANHITHAKHHVSKEYLVTLDHPLKEEDRIELEKGVVILGRKTAPCTIRPGKGNSVSIVLKEGRNRQIRRMFETKGYTVETLKRIRIGHIVLTNLPPGRYKELTKEDVRKFLK